MRERGIIFNAEMVRAVLEGRKTQTRRMLSPRQLKVIDAASSIGECYPLESGHQHANSQSYYREWCPFGAVGDRLWVRETWQCTSFETNEYGHVEGVDYMREIPKQKPHSPAWGVSYEANGFDTGDAEERGFPWRPSIHMPRWASRITLEITGVRVERLNSISEADARAEGIKASKPWSGLDGCVGSGGTPAAERFEALWQSIYGVESWQANPWVWVVEFKRVEGV